MPPNWNKFKQISKYMIEDALGATNCTLSVAGSITYDTKDGEKKNNPTITEIKASFQPTTKDDLEDLPEGARDRKVLKMYTVNKLDGSPVITTNYDGLKYEIIVPSVPYVVSNLVCGYRTYIAKIETHGSRGQ